MENALKQNEKSWQLIFIAWLVATAATLGALFFSEIMKLVPCELCWYQRICIFPLSVILLLGLHPLDIKVVRYALPLAVIGWLFTAYHLLLFYGFIPESLQPCRQGISCADDSMVVMGIPIPLMSLAAFTIIVVALYRARSIYKG